MVQKHNFPIHFILSQKQMRNDWSRMISHLTVLLERVHQTRYLDVQFGHIRLGRRVGHLELLVEQREQTGRPRLDEVEHALIVNVGDLFVLNLLGNVGLLLRLEGVKVELLCARAGWVEMVEKQKKLNESRRQRVKHTATQKIASRILYVRCSFSLAKLINSCSSELDSKISNPKMSKMPTNLCLPPATSLASPMND